MAVWLRYKTRLASQVGGFGILAVAPGCATELLPILAPVTCYTDAPRLCACLLVHPYLLTADLIVHGRSQITPTFD